MCDLKLFQAILLVNCELSCLFSGNVSTVLSNDICYVPFCNSLSSGNSVIKKTAGHWSLWLLLSFYTVSWKTPVQFRTLDRNGINKLTIEHLG
jgi:hypothetical protein